jgi:hypothetical protein
MEKEKKQDMINVKYGQVQELRKQPVNLWLLGFSDVSNL